VHALDAHRTKRQRDLHQADRVQTLLDEGLLMLQASAAGQFTPKLTI